MASAPSEKDLQELLRLLTTTRKLPILQAMGQVKALQAANLRSIQQIADAPLATVESALGQAAAAKSLQNSCKTALKKGHAGKRAREVDTTSSTKRAKTDDYRLPTPAELERSLELPVFVPADAADASRLAATVLLTNRAPLVLAFAVELLRYTMPEQPPSSRLSLAQAVVSANSRTKALSLGLARATAAEAETGDGWAAGQPRVRILGREVAVLKRGGYTWRGEEEEEEGEEKELAVKMDKDGEVEAGQTGQTGETQTGEAQTVEAKFSHPPGVWSVSPTISLRGSTFVARATTMTDAAQRPQLLRALLAAQPHLRTATHNAWAYRVRGRGHGLDLDAAANLRQDSYDDGESGCGDLMLHVLRELGAVDTLVVLTRWFGGTMLGPDRWRLMRNCVTGALAERLRRTGAEVVLSGEALWGLDLEGDKGSSSSASSSFSATAVVGMPTHRPEAARQYLLKSFATAADGTATPATPATPRKKMTLRALEAEKEHNLSLLLGALRLLYDSWADHVSTAELDRRAWSWYIAVRPEVDSGPAGWGAKGPVRLQAILDLCRVGPGPEESGPRPAQ